MGAANTPVIVRVRLMNAALTEPAPVRIAGKPWGSPRYSIHCRPIGETRELCDAIDAAVFRRWPEGPPAQLRHPLRLNDAGTWFHAGAPGDEPPELYHLAGGEVLPGLGSPHTLKGAEALVSVEVQAYQPMPWASGCDILLRAVCIVEAGAQTGAAASFTAALRGIPNAA